MTAPYMISVAGARLTLDRLGAIWWPAHKTLVAGDLHFEKASSFAARRGQLLPPYDTARTLGHIMRLINHYQPDRFIALGDSFHDAAAADRLAEKDRAAIKAIADQVELIWIEGNHDPHPPQDLGGQVLGEFSEGPLTFRHEPQQGPQRGEIAGHLHPVGMVRVRGRALRRRAFASDGQRLILPAFGALTGGLEVTDPAFAPLFGGPFHAHMIGRERIVPVKSTRLLKR